MDLSKLAGTPLPPWARIAAILAAACCLFLLGAITGVRYAGEQELARADLRAAQTVKLAKAQVQVVWKTEIKYVDRIQTIYQKGETIEKAVPVYVTPADDANYGVNAGFVRSYNAAWANDPAGPAAESDREPAGIPLADIAEADAHNASACFAWREQALGLRELYLNMQAVMASDDPEKAVK